MKLLGENVRLKEINEHLAMVIIAFDLFNATAQPRVIKECSKDKVVFDIRNSVSPMQIRRLIVEPLAKAMPEYIWQANIEGREIIAQRVASGQKRSKAAKSTETDAKSSS